MVIAAPDISTERRKELLIHAMEKFKDTDDPFGREYLIKLNISPTEADWLSQEIGAIIDAFFAMTNLVSVMAGKSTLKNGQKPTQKES